MAANLPGTRREAILMFYFADRIKAELMLASRLLTSLSHMEGLEREGATRLYLEFLKGLEHEIHLGQTVISDQEMVRVRTVLTGLLGMVDANMLQDIQPHLTWMISVMATYAQRGMEYLVQEKSL